MQNFHAYMSAEDSVLGKHARDGEDPKSLLTDDSEDEIGPMPLPAADQTKTKKKRKGWSRVPVIRIRP